MTITTERLIPMPLSFSKYINIAAACVLLSFPCFGGSFSMVVDEEDTTVRMDGHVYDTLLNNPDTLPVKAKIVLESIPYGNEIGIISSNESGQYEYFINPAYTYNISVSSENHQKHKEVFNPKPALTQNGIKKDFFLEPELKENQVIRLNKLIFEQGKASITSASFQELQRLINILNDNPLMRIQLEGHTDYRGSKKLNMVLSEDRVEAVKSYLTSRGIHPKRIKTKAYGGTRPLTREQSIEASQINRRVEVRILKL
jgi:OOP family OmpA-OmpF porin